ncbi:1,4-alpha-glucan branching protein GlgB [candidate division CSSED10-310 bacterium]|uniref:1,4-alpha-glucan branching enzyme GlgB n=1 Tax=candidate division CSSED10-310 bacterium TaxID=2855610 RepID=A0ABV6YYC5_UNCC1
MKTTVSQDDLLRIVYGDHDDPFSVLGYHQLEQPAHTVYTIRVFVPDAISVIIYAQDREPIQAKKCHPAGFFEAILEREMMSFPYLLDVTLEDGQVIRMHDAYCFWSIMSPYDIHLIGEGTQQHVFEKLGAHPMTINDVSGVYFAVWAPDARRVSVTGDFNRWNGRQNPMRKLKPAGIWELFIPDIGFGDRYKYEVVFQTKHILMKTDPYAFASELRPRCASIVTDLESYQWGDADWMTARRKKKHLELPLSIYEVHLGSWQQDPDTSKEIRFLNYRELAEKLVAYVLDMGYTHLEILPISEHLLDASWGYQVTGFYSPTSRYGSPDDFKYFVDYCHQHGIGVFMDWVPGHFPRDYTALARYDGTALYEHLDPRRGFHPQWGTYIFNFSRNEVRNFLIGSALFWLQYYHLDGLRVDAVASMLNLNFGRKEGEWLPNEYGGIENLEAVKFLQELNDRVHEQFPDVLMMAEESSSWPLTTGPTYRGGLGFDMKWNMGWMNDSLKYMSADPIYRKFQHSVLTWSIFYAFSENFILPLSHDEVVHLKKSILGKMPGDEWKKMANVRLFYGYQYGHPGKKLLFMGGEFGQWREWTELMSLQWEVLQNPLHQKLQTYVRDLNKLYRQEPCLYEIDGHSDGFLWIDFADADRSVIAFMRKGKKKDDELIWIFNFTPIPRPDYRIGVPKPGYYKEIFNSDLEKYGGSNVGNFESVAAVKGSWQIFEYSCPVSLPPLGVIVFRWSGSEEKNTAAT